MCGYIFERHNFWKIYFGGNDPRSFIVEELHSENSQIEDIGWLLYFAERICLDYSSWPASIYRTSCIEYVLLLWPAHGTVQLCDPRKKEKKSRGYSSFTVVYCATLHSIEFLWTLSGIVRKRFAPHCFLMRHAVSAAQLAKLHIWYITYISVHRKSKKKLNNVFLW